MTEADVWKAKAHRLEQRLGELRRVRARVADIAHALNVAMATRDEARERVRAQELADARDEAAAARQEWVKLRLAHWKASNAAALERSKLEAAQADMAREPGRALSERADGGSEPAV